MCEFWYVVCCFNYTLNLGGGFKHSLFSLLLGEDSHFFQKGWNHQPVILYLLKPEKHLRTTPNLDREAGPVSPPPKLKHVELPPEVEVGWKRCWGMDVMDLEVTPKWLWKVRESAQNALIFGFPIYLPTWMVDVYGKWVGKYTIHRFCGILWVRESKSPKMHPKCHYYSLGLWDVMSLWWAILEEPIFSQRRNGPSKRVATRWGGVVEHQAVRVWGSIGIFPDPSIEIFGITLLWHH